MLFLINFKKVYFLQKPLLFAKKTLDKMGEDGYNKRVLFEPPV